MEERARNGHWDCGPSGAVAGVPQRGLSKEAKSHCQGCGEREVPGRAADLGGGANSRATVNRRVGVLPPRRRGWGPRRGVGGRRKDLEGRVGRSARRRSEPGPRATGQGVTRPPGPVAAAVAVAEVARGRRWQRSGI